MISAFAHSSHAVQIILHNIFHMLTSSGKAMSARVMWHVIFSQQLSKAAACSHVNQLAA